MLESYYQIKLVTKHKTVPAVYAQDDNDVICNYPLWSVLLTPSCTSTSRKRHSKCRKRHFEALDSLCSESNNTNLLCLN